MSVKIIVDSASDVRVQDAEAWGVGFAPLKTILAGKEYRDGIDMTPDIFYDLLKANKELASTSQVTSAEFADHFSAAVEAGDEVVCITLSSGLSGTYQAARVAAADFEGKVFVVDSLSATCGEQVLLAHALKLRDEGKSAKEIYDALMEIRSRLRLALRVETLEYLKRGGRVSKTAAVIGGMLHIMPILRLNAEGKLETINKARGGKMSHKLLGEFIKANGGIDENYPVAITYAGDLADGEMDEFFQNTADVLGACRDKVTVGQLGTVIGTHTGPGAIIVSFVAKA